MMLTVPIFFVAFIFALSPATQVHRWVGKRQSGAPAVLSNDNSSFVLASASELAVGGGGAGIGLHLDAELRVSSAPCATFGNGRSLLESDVGDEPRMRVCEASSVEVWALHPHN